MLFSKRSSVRTLLLVGSALAAYPAVAQTAAQDEAETADPAAGSQDVQDIVVTGTTSRNRPLITASSDITLADRDAIDRRAPRSTADLLELVPGIFVEGTLVAFPIITPCVACRAAGNGSFSLKKMACRSSTRAVARTFSFRRI